MSFSSDCMICKKEVGEDDSGLACERCAAWSHPSCLNMSEDLYKDLANFKNIVYLCDSCLSIVNKAVKDTTIKTDVSSNSDKRKTKPPKKQKASSDSGATGGGKTSSSTHSGNQVSSSSKSAVGITKTDAGNAANAAWRTVGNSKKIGESKYKAKLGKKQVTNTVNYTVPVSSNRFGVLDINIGQPKSECTLIGDSITRGQSDLFCHKGKKARRSWCIPGAGLDHLTYHVKKADKDKGSLIVHGLGHK